MNVRKKLLYLVYKLSGGGFDKKLSQILGGNEFEVGIKHRDSLLSYVNIEGDVPILTKRNIRNGAGYPVNKLDGAYKNSSGGSTGEPVTFWQDNEYRNWSNATERYYYKKFLGVDYDTAKKVVLWGSERDAMKQADPAGRLFNWLSNTIFLNTFNVGEGDWLKYVGIINKEKPVFVKGYAGSLYQISKVINKNRVKMHRPKFVYSSAETLRDFMRQEIELAFGAKVYDFYGSREVGPIAGECKHGKKHIFVFNNVVEVVDFKIDKICKPGSSGRILVTNLHNQTMPLIRYEIGDVGSLGVGKCKCGSDLPWFEKLEGRITDYFVAKDGTTVHGEFFTHLFYHRQWVEKFQVNQRKHNLIEILVVLSGEVAENDREEIEAKIKKVMGGGCRVIWKFVKEIQPSGQGKFLFTKSDVDK